MRSAQFGMMTSHQIQAAFHKARPIPGERQTESDAAVRIAVGFASAAEGFEDDALVAAVDARSIVHNVQVQSIFRG